jgi:hypothetical protein
MEVAKIVPFRDINARKWIRSMAFPFLTSALDVVSGQFQALAASFPM